MAEKKSNTGLYVIIITAILLGFTGIWYFFLRGAACDPNKNGYDKKGKLSGKCKVDDPTITHVPPPSGCQWVADTTFPLHKCSWGAKVKAVQKALGFSATAQDGRWGAITDSAVQAKLGKNTIDNQAEFDKLVNPVTPPTGGGGNTTVNPVGKIATAKVDNVPVYLDSDFSLFKTASKGEFIGTIQGDADDKNYFLINGTNGDYDVLKSQVSY